jgi:hypothetical protein
LVDHFANARDVLLADAADEDEVGLPWDDVLRHPAFLPVMLTAAAAPHIHRGLDACLGIRLLQLGNPTGPHRVVHNAVAQRQQAQIAALSEQAARAPQMCPIGGRPIKLAGRHRLLDGRDLGQRTARRAKQVVVLLGGLALFRDVRRELGGPRALFGESDGRIGPHAARTSGRVDDIAVGRRGVVWFSWCSRSNAAKGYNLKVGQGGEEVS